MTFVRTLNGRDRFSVKVHKSEPFIAEFLYVIQLKKNLKFKVLIKPPNDFEVLLFSINVANFCWLIWVSG